MKKSLIYLGVAILAIVLCGNICAQKYSKVKITLKDGSYIEGKKGILTHDKINFVLAEVPKDYALQEVSMIMGKKNRIGAYAAGFGGGCFAICMIAVLANPNDADQGQLFAGALIWTGLFTGLGAGIGALASKWKTIYVGNQHTAFLDRVNLSFSSHREAPYNIGLVYKLKH